jgi:MEDS: MEthanogen/methylotroph, DcmR Sensory domain
MSVTVKALSSDKPSESLAPSDPTASPTHIVVFYEDESLLLDILTQSIYDALQAGNSAMVIATHAHHDGLFHRLGDRGAVFHTAILENRLFLLDAAETLVRFMVDDQPDPNLFEKIMGNYVELLVAAARGKGRQVFTFGEMVSVLWQQGQHAAAVRIEQLWGDLVASRSFHLCSAYSLRLVPTDAGSGTVTEIGPRGTRILGSNDLLLPCM